GVTSVVRSVAHFKSTMTPELAPLPTPGACVNLYETGGWPLGQGTNSNYLDVGQVTISGVNAAGDPTEIAVPLASEDNVMTFPLDDLGRPHDRFYQTILP